MITAITNGRLWDGIHDEPLEDSTVITENGAIMEVYQGTKPLPAGTSIIDAKRMTVMPGLIDAHEHFAVTNNDMGATYFDPPLFTALRIKAQLEKILQAGFTTVRDGGGGHWSIKQAVEDGLIDGPRLLISGALFSTTGGHGDFNVRGESVFPPEPRFFDLMRVCDGTDDCRKAMREQFRKGADQIKICVTGGCASPNDEAWHLQFSEDEIRAIVEEANARGTYVMAHCLNDRGIKRAVDCGVRSIEHGCFMSEKSARLMKEKGAVLVTTMAVVAWAMDNGVKKGAAEWFVRKLSDPGCSPDRASLLEGMIRGAQMALKEGVPLGSGSDFFGTMCGGEAQNIVLIAEFSSPLQALKAATSVNAEVLRMEDRIGSIEPSKWADIIIVDGCPDENPSVLTSSENIKLVMKEGRIAKNLL